MTTLSVQVFYGRIAHVRMCQRVALLPPTTKLAEGYIFTGVCDSVHRGVCLSACWNAIPPGAGIPLDQAPQPGTPQKRHTAPGAKHVGRYGQRVSGMHPTGMQSYSVKNYAELALISETVENI